jgi:anaerobic selenocysteine-containing dehydrogenase
MNATNLINGLLGATDVPGGITGESFNPLIAPGPDGTVEPNPGLTVEVNEWVGAKFKYPPDHLDLSEFYPHKHSTAYVAWRAIANPEKYHLTYNPKVMLIFGANPIANNCNIEEIISALKKIPFIVSISYHMDEMTQFADVVLAESANLERLNFNEYQAFGPRAGKRGLRGLNFRYPVIEPLFDTLDSNSMFLELIKRLGINQPAMDMLNKIFQLNGTDYELDPIKPYQWEDIVDRVLKSRFGKDKGVEFFKAQGFAWTAHWLPEEKTYNYFYFPDGHTRYAIYNERLQEKGRLTQEQFTQNNVTAPGWDMDQYLAFFNALPSWMPHPEHEAAQEFDLYAVNWKIGTRIFGMGGLDEIAQVREMQIQYSTDVNSILINVETARIKGIKDGDRVIVESQHGGKVEGVIKTTNLLHPKTIGFVGNFGRQAMYMGPMVKKGVNYNQLLSAADGLFDPVTGAIDITAAVKLTKVV